MNDELFSVPVQLSPRLRWLQKHDVSTESSKWDDGAWAAWTGLRRYAEDMDEVCFGKTEDEALVKLAKKHGWKLWNEE